jgi:hypothetical protein
MPSNHMSRDDLMSTTSRFKAPLAFIADSAALNELIFVPATSVIACVSEFAVLS